MRERGYHNQLCEKLNAAQRGAREEEYSIFHCYLGNSPKSSMRKWDLTGFTIRGRLRRDKTERRGTSEKGDVERASVTWRERGCKKESQLSRERRKRLRYRGENLKKVTGKNASRLLKTSATLSALQRGVSHSQKSGAHLLEKT